MTKHISYFEVNEFMRKWCKELNLNIKTTFFKVKEDTLHIFTMRPGIWIGKKGETIHKFEIELIEYCYENGLEPVRISIEDVDPVISEEDESNKFDYVIRESQNYGY